jgi:hypothetical protein
MTAEMCEHGDYRAACLECLGQPRRRTPRPPAKPTRPTFTPRSPADEIRELAGDKDVSVPVPFLESTLGVRTTRLRAYGYPHDLRRGGWVYLRMGRALVARVRVVRMAWRDDELDPGMIFEVGPDTWEEVHFPLGDLADSQHQGYRYLITSSDGLYVVHLTSGDPVPEEDDDCWPSAPAA